MFTDWTQLYTSSLRAEDVPLSLNGTLVQCVDPEDLQIIGSATICILNGIGLLIFEQLSQVQFFL